MQSNPSRILGILMISLALTSFTISFTTHPVRATPPPPSILIVPTHHPTAPQGTTVTFQVNVSNIDPNFPVSGWVIYVDTNNQGQAPDNVLKPTSENNVTWGNFLSLTGGFETVRCVDGVATVGSCGGNDGAGIVHDEFATGATNYGNGTLFTISYTVVSGSPSAYTFVTLGVPGVNSYLYDASGLPFRVSLVSGDYGPVPVLPVASFTIPPAPLYETDPILFNASSSSDPNNHKIILYDWTFIQSSQSVQPIERITNKTTITQIFPKGSQGNWTATLSVENDQHVYSNPVSLEFTVAVKIIHDLVLCQRLASQANLICGLVASQFDGILAGQKINITVIVSNLGTTPENNINVTVTVAGNQFNGTYSHLEPPGSRTQSQVGFSFIWDTTGLQPDTYRIHAVVHPAVNQTDTVNNHADLYVRIVYPYTGSNVSLGLFQFTGLSLLALIGIGIVIWSIRSVQERRARYKREML